MIPKMLARKVIKCVHSVRGASPHTMSGLARLLSTQPSVSEVSEALEHVGEEERKKDPSTQPEPAGEKLAPPKLDRNRVRGIISAKY